LVRWRPDGSDERVRHAEITARRVQREVAVAVRDSLGRRDVVGEEVSLMGLLERMKRRGFKGEDVTRLETGFRLPITPLDTPPATFLAVQTVEDITTVEGSASAVVDKDALDKDKDSIDEGFGTFPPASPGLPTEPRPGNGAGLVGEHVVSISRRSRFRRLHAIGKCWRIPGRDYGAWALLPELGPDLYDAICKDC